MSETAVLDRDRRRRWAAPGSGHDRIIGLARVLLPAGIGMLVAFLSIAPLTMASDMSFVLDKDKVEVAKERMRVTEAIYRGEDSKGQAFQLRAGSAVQKTSAEPIVRLQTLAARLDMADGPAVLTANTARYDMDKENVAVDGPVLFRAQDGYRLETRDVLVDLKTRQVASQRPVDGQMPLGTFSADTMSADLQQRTVRLDGRARLRIVQGKGK